MGSDLAIHCGWNARERHLIDDYFHSIQSLRSGAELIMAEPRPMGDVYATITNSDGDELVSIHRVGKRYALAKGLTVKLEGPDLSSLLKWHRRPLEAVDD